MAVGCAVAVGIAGVQVITSSSTRQPAVDTASSAAPPAQGIADAAAAAFSDSAVGTDPALSTQQRSAGLPIKPVVGLVSHTAAGPVELVLPGGLGDAVITKGGQVVYPNRGAGFDFMAENTGTGTRTVSRIASPAGVRMVTTFVRTPADTVMLAHTSGYLTINRATPKAETIGMFSPAETRDAAGKLVPSSYVVRQLAPQLYQLSEVIDPRAGTSWSVYVDPPLHLVGPGGVPLPQGLFESISGAVSAVGDAVTTAAAATVSGAQAVGTFVKENPLESAMLVGGVALALTGVGGPASVAMITVATVNIASAGVDIAAAAMPENEALGYASTALGIASMATPQGAAKKVVEEGVEQALKHADDVVDVAKAIPTPPVQLVEEVAARAPAPAIPGATTPKLPNAPPTELPASPLSRGVPCAGQSFSPDTAVLLGDRTSWAIAQLSAGDRVWSTDPATGRSSAQSVQAVLVNHDTDLLDLTVTNAAGDQSLIHTTSGHPFYRPSLLGAATGLANNIGTGSNGPGWVDAEDLRPGDVLATADGSIAHVAASRAVPRAADMWDLTIEATHTFYVATASADVLVHNCPMSAPGSRPFKTFTPRGKDKVWEANEQSSATPPASTAESR